MSTGRPIHLPPKKTFTFRDRQKERVAAIKTYRQWRDLKDPAMKLFFKNEIPVKTRRPPYRKPVAKTPDLVIQSAEMPKQIMDEVSNAGKTMRRNRILSKATMIGGILTGGAMLYFLAKGCHVEFTLPHRRPTGSPKNPLFSGIGKMGLSGVGGLAAVSALGTFRKSNRSLEAVRNWIRHTRETPVAHARDKYEYFLINRKGDLIFTNEPAKLAQKMPKYVPDWQI